MTVHGGDVWQMAEEVGVEPTALLDFSANVNPRGLPPRALEQFRRSAADPTLLQMYPDPSARLLRRTLAQHLQISDEAIVIGPGAEALLAPALAFTRAKSVLVPVPAFSEYRRICEQLHVEFVPWPLERSAGFRIPGDRLCAYLQSGNAPPAIILNNPHNPAGALLERSEVSRIVEAAESAGVAVILDEAFIDYAPGHSLAQEAVRRPGLIVVRSLTKFYGCPGLRVGYAISHPDTISIIRSRLPTWAVAQLAMDVLSEALRDADYARKTLRALEVERAELTAALVTLGPRVIPSAANYLLAELAPAMTPSAELRLRLARRHRILIRNCDSYEGLEMGRWIRLAVRSTPENLRLITALKEELNQP